MIRRRLTARNTPVRGLRFSPEKEDRPTLEGNQGSQPVEEAEEGSTEQETVRSAEEWLMEVIRLKKEEKALEAQQHDLWEKIERAEANFLESVSQGDESIH